MANNPFMPGSTPAPNAASAANAPAMPPVPGAAAANQGFEIDLSSAANGFVIPDGLYRVRCVGVEQTVSNAGNPMFKWSFVVTEGEHAGHDFLYFTALTPAAMWKVAEVVVALGVGQAGQVVKFKASDVINREAVASVEKSEYNGQERSQIRSIASINT